MRRIIGRSRRSSRPRRREGVRVEAVGPRIICKSMGCNTSVLHVDDEVAALRIPDDTGMRRGRAERHGVRVVAGHGADDVEHVKRVRVQTPGGALELVGRPLVRVLIQIPSFIVHGQIQTGLPGPLLEPVWWW